MTDITHLPTTEAALFQISQSLERIASALERLALSNEPEEPNHILPLEQFAAFDWNSIGASIVQQDQFGPTCVEWSGTLWTRRSPSNKFGEAIWYSRSIGKDAEGKVKYLRLITFRKITGVDPLPPSVAEATKVARPEPATATSPTTNGNGVHRPYSPEMLRQRLAEISSRHTGKEASQGQRNLLAMMLNKCFAGENDYDARRHAVQRYLFGVASLADVFDSLVLAALDWLKPTRDSGGDYHPAPLAIKEVQAVYRQILVDEGQTQMDI